MQVFKCTALKWSWNIQSCFASMSSHCNEIIYVIKKFPLALVLCLSMAIRIIDQLLSNSSKSITTLWSSLLSLLEYGELVFFKLHEVFLVLAKHFLELWQIFESQMVSYFNLRQYKCTWYKNTQTKWCLGFQGFWRSSRSLHFFFIFLFSHWLCMRIDL